MLVYLMVNVFLKTRCVNKTYKEVECRRRRRSSSFENDGSSRRLGCVTRPLNPEGSKTVVGLFKDIHDRDVIRE